MRSSRCTRWRSWRRQSASWRIYTEKIGQPPLPTRLMVGIAILKHSDDLSDEVLAIQYFCNSLRLTGIALRKQLRPKMFHSPMREQLLFAKANHVPSYSADLFLVHFQSSLH